MDKTLRSNLSDEDILTFRKVPLKKKLQLLDEMNAFLQRFSIKREARLWEKYNRSKSLPK